MSSHMADKGVASEMGEGAMVVGGSGGVVRARGRGWGQGDWLWRGFLIASQMPAATIQSRN